MNVNHGYVHSAKETDWVPGIFELARTARAAGYLTVVVTNQAGIARGLYSEAEFLDYTAWVHSQFRDQRAPLAATYYCPHHPDAGVGEWLRGCDCRKPAPGMLRAAADELVLDLDASVLIGDQPSDIQAAEAACMGRAWLFSGQRDGLSAFGRRLAMQAAAAPRQEPRQ